MKFASTWKEALFLHRENRFCCRVWLEGREEQAHLANSGRLKDLLSPWRPVLLAEKCRGVQLNAPARKTRYDLSLIVLGGILVSVDARVPAELVAEALLQGKLPQFRRYPTIQREALRGESRLDFRLSRGEEECFLEVKSVTLVRGGRAFFPDAPTSRGRRHIETLLQAKREGQEAAIVFVVQREDASSFSPNDATDPQFGEKLREAGKWGVGVYAYNCQVREKSIELAEEIPVCC